MTLKLIDDQNWKHHNAVSVTQHIKERQFSYSCNSESSL